TNHDQYNKKSVDVMVLHFRLMIFDKVAQSFVIFAQKTTKARTLNQCTRFLPHELVLKTASF
ncbi:MAG: hypothetical protein ACO3MJ_10130, partial [Alphaproteobacteria bacterium]